MYQERLMLSPKDILEKEFKIDTRGYRPQEVDKYLDIVIRDYEEAFTIMKELDTDKKELIEENIALKKEIRNLKTKLDVLSDREKDIIICITKGMNNKEIADYLFLSVHTVTTHRRNISNKLQIHTTAGLIIYAIANKLVDINDIQK